MRSTPHYQTGACRGSHRVQVRNNFATDVGDTHGVRPWVANLLGLAAGFTIGGAALNIWYSSNQVPGGSLVGAPPAPRRDAGSPPRLPVLRPVELPRIEALPPPLPDTMPRVIRPDLPPATPEDHKPGTGAAGTGFFVASDGTLMTAAHVVSGCAQIRIVSKLVGLAWVEMLAVDAGPDIALLRAPRVTPPATLPIGRPAAPDGRLFVLGYPGNGGLLIPTETWATLENAHFPPGPAQFTDPQRTIWIAATAIGHGFSGGSILDPRNGVVVGIVHGMLDSTRLHASGMAIGPGSSPLAALLRRQGTNGDALSVKGEDELDAARRATVHVLCLY